MGLKTVFSVWLFAQPPTKSELSAKGKLELTRPFFAFPPLVDPIGLIESNAYVAQVEEFTNSEPFHPHDLFRLFSPIDARFAKSFDNFAAELNPVTHGSLLPIGR